MKTQEFFKIGNNDIGWINSDFLDNFSDIDFTIPVECNLKSKTLSRPMNDKEILTELKPQESTLGELAYSIENNKISRDDKWNIFYIRDKKNNPWAVRVRWYSDSRDWYVRAYSVSNANPWGAGGRVFSRDWNFEPSEPLKISSSEPLKIIEIEYLGNRYRLIN